MLNPTKAEREKIRAEVRAARHAAQQQCIKVHAELFQRLREAPRTQRGAISMSGVWVRPEMATAIARPLPAAAPAAAPAPVLARLPVALEPAPGGRRVGQHAQFLLHLRQVFTQAALGVLDQVAQFGRVQQRVRP